MSRTRLDTAGLIAVGLTAAATAHATPFDFRTQLTRAERGALAVAESYLSSAAAAVEANGTCFSHTATVVIAADASGNADGVWGKGATGNYELRSFLSSASTNGTKHTVVDILPPGTIGTLVRVEDYATTPVHAFSRYGDVFIDSADIFLSTSSAFSVKWDELSIKNFFVDFDHSTPRQPCLIRDEGLEAIAKDGFPLAEWRERSEYARNACFYRFPGRPGLLDDHVRVVKTRVFPANTCTIKLDADFVFDGTNADIAGVISVSP